MSGSAYGTSQPPCWKLLLRSSSGAPGACMTPSNDRNVVRVNLPVAIASSPYMGGGYGAAASWQPRVRYGLGAWRPLPLRRLKHGEIDGRLGQNYFIPSEARDLL